MGSKQQLGDSGAEGQNKSAREEEKVDRLDVVVLERSYCWWLDFMLFFTIWQ